MRSAECGLKCEICGAEAELDERLLADEETFGARDRAVLAPK